jgi:hypothetical protein
MWEVFMLASLCDLNIGELNKRLKNIKWLSWDSLLSAGIIDPKIVEQQTNLNIRRKCLPNTYIRSKATVIGAMTYSNGLEEYNAWRSSVLSVLDKDESTKVQPYLREVFETSQELVHESAMRDSEQAVSSQSHNSMNLNQRIALIIGSAVLMVMLLFPPWRFGGGKTAGYHILFLPPERSIYIDFGRLLLQCILIGALTGVIFLLLKSKQE